MNLIYYQHYVTQRGIWNKCENDSGKDLNNGVHINYCFSKLRALKELLTSDNKGFVTFL